MKKLNRAGVNHYCAKLNNQKARTIVRSYSRYHPKKNSLSFARKYKVAKTTIWQILEGRSWRHATGVVRKISQPKKEKILVRCSQCHTLFQTSFDGPLHTEIKKDNPVFCSCC